MTMDNPKLGEYARKLRWALAALPEADRDDIVAEMRSHVLDRVDTGSTVDEALAALGTPEDYARAFCENYTVASALSSRRTPHLLHALVEGATHSAGAIAAFAAIVMLWAVPLLVAYTALLKIGDPSHVGLWRGQDFFFIGIIDDPSTGTELLGPWITPLAMLLIVAAWLITRSIAVWALRRLLPST
ncbi:MAG: hypothetical protein MUE46_12595 [Xanthomonadales bacterium]|jgi:hypothetical protein|nr:hypothetical protein [Xanthomonadales bacterium]